MDITKANYREKLPEIEAAIEKSSFLAIDCEFTGLSTENNIYPYDRPEDAYRKTCANSADYIIVQLGLTIVRVSEEDPNKFLYSSYNFYIFPRLWKHSFRCQGTSMIFLAENGFDFTRLFREGISYSNRKDEKQLREKLAERQKWREDQRNTTSPEQLSGQVAVPEEEKEAIDRIKQIVEDFLKSDEKEKVIGDCNAFQRKLIYGMLQENFSDRISASTKSLDNNMKVLLLERKKTPDEEQKIEDEKRLSEQMELEDCIGISSLLNIISRSKKLIVGHNMLLDVIFILRQFFGPLPEEYKFFKKFAHTIFPNIIDTKYMCALEPLKSKVKSSVLGHVVQTVSEEPFVPVPFESETPEYIYSLNDTKAHEAGYDSFLTTIVYLRLTKFLNIPPENINKNGPQLQPYLNRIFLMRIQDICFVNLTGNEPSPSRDHVFHVSMPEVWKQSDLVNHFKNYGPIFVTWINSSSALISLQNRENSKAVLKTIGIYPGVRVQSFNDFKKSLEKRLSASEKQLQAAKRKHSSESASSEDGDSKTRKSKKLINQKEQIDPVKKTFTENDDWS